VGRFVAARLKQAAEKVGSVTSAANAADENKIPIAALKRCATQSQTFSAACKSRALRKTDS